LAAGLALSLGLNRFIASLVGNTANNALIATSVSLLLLAVSTMACLMPIRKAVSVDPMIALRHE
jgi:ABC-type antimicrobial peptide transport system permease subunit